ncbi:complexin-3-like [Dromaius novaehollandiae]|uniref:complexin-3-like n=1 Tax=Dromaius novaehollandiae TaxID=8790 RepID=UPI00311E2B5F
MESTVKSFFGAPVKQLLCCISANFPEDMDSPSLGGHLKGPGEQRHDQRSQEEKNKRNEFYAEKKAEQAAMRSRLREKYRLPESEVDRQQLAAFRRRAGPGPAPGLAAERGSCSAGAPRKAAPGAARCLPGARRA